MPTKALKIIRPDSKGRVPLGHFDNKTALNQVKQGLKDSGAGRVEKRGSFAKYTEEDTE